MELLNISDLLALLALCISTFALWRTESTAKDQLSTELFVAAHLVISITTEAFPLLAECHEKLGINGQEDLHSLTKMQRNALEIASQDSSGFRKNELLKQIGNIKADRIHAERCIKKYQKYVDN